jgi:hypothetical protein
MRSVGVSAGVLLHLLVLSEHGWAELDPSLTQLPHRCTSEAEIQACGGHWGPSHAAAVTRPSGELLDSRAFRIFDLHQVADGTET